MTNRSELGQPTNKAINSTTPTVLVRCFRCNTPEKCAVHGCSPLTWPAEKTNSAVDKKTQALLMLAEAAKEWWEAFRPELYTVADHIANPTVNHSDPELDGELCHAIANWVNVSA